MPTSLHGRPGAAGGASALQPLLKPCLLVSSWPTQLTGLPTPRGQAKEGQELRLRGDPRGEVRSAWAPSPGLIWAGGDVAISQRSREGSGIPGWHRRGFGDGGVLWGPLD